MPQSLSDLQPLAPPEAALARAPRGATPPQARGELDVGFVPLSALRIDRRYQRRVSQASLGRICKIVETFSWSRFGALIVSGLGDGSFAVVDGQHRALAAAALGLDEVPAVTVTGDLAAQAGDFVGINSIRTGVASVDRFRARVAAGAAEAVEVADILDELGISTNVPAGAGLKPRQTRAVVALERAVKHHGRGLVFTALECLLDAQPDEDNLLTRQAITATCALVAAVVGDNGDLDQVVAALTEIDFDDVAERAAMVVKARGGSHDEHARAILFDEWNRKRRKVA